MIDAEIFKSAIFIWFAIGLVFSILEFLIPGLIIIFFGLGGIITSIVCAIFNIGIDAQIVIFLTTSLVSLFVLRKYLKSKYFDEESDENMSLEQEFIGETAVAINDFASNGIGKVEFNGTQWNAESTNEIKKGDLLEIIDKKSIKLIVKLKN